ncbi:uncharacterized protein METZ01_LOCUS100457, partial [marine metagenome]
VYFFHGEVEYRKTISQCAWALLFDPTPGYGAFGLGKVG